MSVITEDDGYRLDRDRSTAGRYSLFLTDAGREHEWLFDRVVANGGRVILVRDAGNFGSARVGELDPGVLETDVGEALEAIARGEEPEVKAHD